MRKIKEILLIHCRNIIRSLAWITLIEPVTNLIRRVYVITMYNSSCTLKMFTRRKWDLLLLGWFDFLPLSISCVQCSVLSWLMMLTTIDMVWRCGCCDTWHQVLLTSLAGNQTSQPQSKQDFLLHFILRDSTDSCQAHQYFCF